MTKNKIILFLLLMSLSCKAQSLREVHNELISQGVPYPNIVLAQARLETGNFKSKLYKTHHNLFGIKYGKKYASYPNWRASIADYKKRISSRYKGGDYYAFLKKIGYARDKSYTNKLKQFK